jgi:KDO2-lipid IV(A) lauroyltransferase
MVETIKTLTITKKQAKERCKFNNLEVFEKYYQQNQHIILVLGHYGNWELAGAGMNAQSAYQLYVIYKPLANKYFNRLIIKMRTRLGNSLIPMKETFRQMLVINKDKKPSAVAFIADQTPAPENAYWTTFLNQETPVFWGTELIARKLNFPIIYTSIKRVKRGYYEIDLEVLEAHPKNTKEGEISEKHTKRLEKDIINCPEIWLWTHRRWKHKKPSNLK